ncbi:MAG: sugar ABC transporter substrate-binding protein [Elusimicrobia bacterium]|nr:sugar ABC transporter substrate-binding protein [Candidatus Liberimonas magnetica]
MKKISVLLITGSILFSGFIGCGKKNEAAKSGEAQPPEIRVAFWGAVEEKEIITTTINAWEKEHPNIKVVLQHIPAGSYSDKILTEIAGGNPPDIIFSDVDIFVTFINKDALLDLTQFLNADKSFNISDFFPGIVDRFTVNGKIYCIPRDVAPFGVIFYNKTLFDKLKVKYPSDDWNMNDFVKTAEKLTVDENGKTPLDKGFNPKKIQRYGFWGWSIHNFIYSFGGKFVDDVKNPKKCIINEKPSVDGMQFFMDLSDKYYIAPMTGALTNMGMSINQLFSMEKLAMFQSGIWETPNLRRLIGNRFDWDVVMSPKGPDGKRGFGTGGSGYAIMKVTKHPQEAWEVLKCLAGDKGQEMLADNGLAQPANKKISEGPFWAGSPKQPANKKMLNEAVQYSVYNPFHPKWREAWDKFVYPQIDLIFNKRITVKEGLDKAAEKVNSAFAGNE